MNKNLLIASLILIIGAAAGIWFRPLMIIDETRYIGVAWEMFDKHSFLVPLINGEPYHHKPPFLFWLMHLDWWLFGVNATSVRFISLIFGLGSLFLTYRIYRLLWRDDREGASFAPLLLAGSFVFMFYTSLLMFDVVLTFWVLVGMLGILEAYHKPSRKSFILIALSVGFGILTKGPVILVHLLPVILFAKLWMEKIPQKFFLGFSLATLTGIGIALLWAIPAGIAGGEAYRNAIFWGQTANRVVKSFAHQRPFWWYLPILPLLAFPWFLLKHLWQGTGGYKIERGTRFLLVWLVSVILIFSFISGKQVHYLLPEIPAFALLGARWLQHRFTAQKETFQSTYIGQFYIVFAIALAIAYIFVHQKLHFAITPAQIVIVSLLLLGTGIVLLKYRFHSFERLLQAIAASSAILMFALHFLLADYFHKQDMTPFARKIAALQQSGIPVIHLKKYHNQFAFPGRLHDKIVVLNEKEKQQEYFHKHPEAVVILYKKPHERYNEEVVLAKGYFRSKHLLLVKVKDLEKL